MPIVSEAGGPCFGQPAPYAASPVNLSISLADAATTDAKGLVSVIGLGVTRLTVNKFPGDFNGCIVLILTPGEGDAMGTFPVELSVKEPARESPTVFATGEVVVGSPLDQVVLSTKVNFLAPAPGELVFVAKVGETIAMTHVLIIPASETKP